MALRKRLEKHALCVHVYIVILCELDFTNVAKTGTRRGGDIE